jgi:hypothetical protein
MKLIDVLRPMRWSGRTFSELEGQFADKNQLLSLQQDLFSDIETLLPGYFDHKCSPSASPSEKFKFLEEKFKERWTQWRSSTASRKPQGKTALQFVQRTYWPSSR